MSNSVLLKKIISEIARVSANLKIEPYTGILGYAVYRGYIDKLSEIEKEFSAHTIIPNTKSIF